MSFVLSVSISAEENQASQPDDSASIPTGGPCIIGPDGKLQCKIPATDDSASVQEESQMVDLEKQPWLVESSNRTSTFPREKRERMIWADSWLWAPIDEIIGEIPVEKWLTPLPESLAGKYVLIEMWATWCPPCRRTLPYLNFIQDQYRDDLVVISICEMDENAILALPNFDIDKVHYSMAVDTGRRLANKLNVVGIPHVIVLEPMFGAVVWEGMPTLPDYELDDKTLEKLFSIGKKLKAENKIPEVSPVKFVVKEATEEERASRRSVNAGDVPPTTSLSEEK